MYTEVQASGRNPVWSSGVFCSCITLSSLVFLLASGLSVRTKTASCGLFWEDSPGRESLATMEKKRKYPSACHHAPPKRTKASTKKRQDRNPREDEQLAGTRALYCLLPGKGGSCIDKRRKKRGLALHREILKHLHAEKEAAKTPWRRLGVWRSRPASTPAGADGKGLGSEGKRELVYVAISGEILGKPVCFRVAAEEKKFLAARGITGEALLPYCLQ